jgi:hypothetical protein
MDPRRYQPSCAPCLAPGAAPALEHGSETNDCRGGVLHGVPRLRGVPARQMSYPGSLPRILARWWSRRGGTREWHRGQLHRNPSSAGTFTCALPRRSKELDICDDQGAGDGIALVICAAECRDWCSKRSSVTRTRTSTARLAYLTAISPMNWIERRPGRCCRPIGNRFN